MGNQNWAIWGKVFLSMWCKVKISIQDYFFYIQRVCDFTVAELRFH